MSGQPTLPPAPRAQDLPPRWDGQPAVGGVKKSSWMATLCAFRCPDCLHDTICDPTGEGWDLDDDDYTDDGSYER